METVRDLGPEGADREGESASAHAVGATRHPARIAFISSVVLVLELALIRLVPAEVRAISYFTNLILMASFFGLGLGCILSRTRPLPWLLPGGLVGVVGFVLYGRGIVVYEEARAVHFWLQSDGDLATARAIPLLPAALAAFLLVASLFVGLGQALARAMDEHRRLVAYSWDIAGSLIGIALFVLGSFVGLPPWVWPPLAMLVWAVVMLGRWPARGLYAVAGLAFLSLGFSSLPSDWSPYYLVQHRAEPLGTRVWVNSSFHQLAIDFTSRTGSEAPAVGAVRRKYGIPYDVYESLHDGRAPDSVLVLGAGTGNDVKIALDRGVRTVVAVEIDPVILRLGMTSNAARPYADPRVVSVVDDARHYLHSTRDRFDLVVFGTLDSQTLLSGHANLRLENYVYTAESMAEVKRVLAPGGMVALYYSVFRDWLYGRLTATVRTAFGEGCRIVRTDDQFLFNTIVMAAPGPSSLGGSSDRPAPTRDAQPSTDDWPFLYLERPTLAPLYLTLLAVLSVLVLAAFLTLRRLHPSPALKADFFLLGCGFTLVEAAAVVRLALLFGSTWVVNAVVFVGALSMIFVANWSVLRRRQPRPGLVWGGLICGLVLNFALPASALLALPLALRTLASLALVGWPVYCAGVCFSSLFSRERQTGYALGINLVGAMAGGWMEYVSMLTGMRSVWLLAIAVYLGALLVSRLRSASTAPSFDRAG